MRIAVPPPHFWTVINSPNHKNNSNKKIKVTVTIPTSLKQSEINLFFLRWPSSLLSLSGWSSPPSDEEEEEELLESEEEDEGRPVFLLRSTLSAKSAIAGLCSYRGEEGERGVGGGG